MIGRIISHFSTPLTVRRTYDTVTFVNGIAQPHTDVNEFCLRNVCVQPVIGRERELLPELIRDREVIKIYNYTKECKLRCVDIEGKEQADRLDYEDEEYVVQSVEDWHLHGAYYKVLAVKEND